jgi:hypothetical protein
MYGTSDRLSLLHEVEIRIFQRRLLRIGRRARTFVDGYAQEELVILHRLTNDLPLVLTAKKLLTRELDGPNLSFRKLLQFLNAALLEDPPSHQNRSPFANRLMSIGLSMAIPITYGEIGALAGAVGSRATYVMGGILLLTCALTGFLNSQLRRYNLSPEPDASGSALVQNG